MCFCNIHRTLTTASKDLGETEKKILDGKWNSWDINWRLHGTQDVQGEDLATQPSLQPESFYFYFF